MATETVPPATEQTASLVVPINNPKIVGWRSQAATVKAEADAMVVDSAEAKIGAVNILGGISRVLREAEALRKSLVEESGRYVRKTDALFREVLAPIRLADETIRDKVRAYERKVLTDAAEKEARAVRQGLEANALADQAAEAEKAGRPEVAEQLLTTAIAREAEAQATPVAGPPPKTVKTDLGTSATTKMVWTYKVTNAAAIPREYFILDDKAVRKAISEGVRAIDGLHIFQDVDLSVRG